MRLKKIAAILCVCALLAGFATSCGKKGESSSGADSSSVSSSSSASESSGSSASSGGDAQDLTPKSPVEGAPSAKLEITKALDIATICSAADKDYVYYVDQDDQHIYRVKHDGSDKKLLSEDEVSWLNITADGKIEYCTNYDPNAKSTYFSINKDGTGREDKKEIVLDIFPTPEYTASNDRTYYLLTENDGVTANGIYSHGKGEDRIKNAKLVLEGVINSFCVVDNYLVSSVTTKDGSYIYRSDLDGGNIIKLFDAQAYYLSNTGEDVFFVNKGDANLIYKLSNAAIKAAK